MILACHQPQYLAWLGYYHKMASCDVWVYLDQVQYKHREFQNRNRIKSSDGELWLTVPVVTKGRRDQAVRDVEIDATQRWQAEHFKSIEFCYRKAPHFADYEEALRAAFARPWTHLMPLCLELDGFLRNRLRITSRTILESEIGSEGMATERIVSLCRRLGADGYLSGAGGKAYLDAAAFEKAGIRLIYQDFHPAPYPQRFSGFLPNLAALDLLFNCGDAAARTLLDAASERRGP